VHAWAALRVYKIEKKRRGSGDVTFLKQVFHRLLLNFTWWVNRKDAEGMNVFQGGFLGLDNIGVFDRSRPLPSGGLLEQSDGTSWMAMYTLNMLAIAMELACQDHAYEDVASKFFEHFIYIADAMNNLGADSVSIWNEDDGFYYDVVRLPPGRTCRSVAIDGRAHSAARRGGARSGMVDKLPNFRHRLEWFIQHRPDRTSNVASMQTKAIASAGCCPSCRGTGCGQSSSTCSTSASSGLRTACDRCPKSTATIRTSSRSTVSSTASTMRRRSRRPKPSAATPTGAAPCGSR
jgi:hypothetical protein